jgi:tRNA/tmRNA/rRNA uracil-C5-methylase (TrmA/RlmC/RlmD family)
MDTFMDTFTATVEKLLYGGDGLARRDDKVVFIPYSVPGDELLVRSVAEKKNFTRAEIVRVLTPGAGRVAPACPHFGRCGGCDWQQLEYPRQVEAKRLILEELFHHRFPETRELEIPMHPSPQPLAYRSRARVQIDRNENGRGRTSVGFFRRGSHIVQDIESCPLFRPLLGEALRELRQTPFGKNRKFDVDEVEIACSDADGAWVIGWPGRSEKPGKEAFLKKQVGSFSYTLSAGSFFQTNDFLIGALVEEVMGLVDNTNDTDGTNGTAAGKESVAVDLYSGAGLFSLPLSRRFGAIAAVEYSREASRLGARNASDAGCANISNICTDVAAWLKVQSPRRFDCIVLDPPRTGVTSGVMEEIVRLAPKTIVYVSCDPQTLARDLGRMNPSPYRIASVAGFDMFPQTYHFETVVKLTAP